MEIVISAHAYKRAKERLSWGKSAIKRMAKKAYKEGVQVSTGDGNRCLVFNNIMYVFRDKCLLSVYQLGKNIEATMNYISK